MWPRCRAAFFRDGRDRGAAQHAGERDTFPEPTSEGLGGVAGVLAVIVVPALGAGLFAVVFWFLARAKRTPAGGRGGGAPWASGAANPPAPGPPPGAGPP